MKDSRSSKYTPVSGARMKCYRERAQMNGIEKTTFHYCCARCKITVSEFMTAD